NDFGFDLANANNLIIVERRRIRNDDLIAFAQPLQHFDRAYGTSSQVDCLAFGFLSIRAQAKHPDRLLALAESRPADIKNVAQPLEFDGAVNAQIGTSTRRQLAGKRDIDGER